MCPPKNQYYIAWILSSHDQYEEAHGHFDETFEKYSTSHITYTLGRVHYHDVVIASPASRTDTPTVEIIINDVLLHFPSIRAGFVVSTDAYISRSSRIEVGDVVMGGNLPDMEHGVDYVDAEKTNKEGRLFMTGQSGNFPAIIATAVRDLRNDRGRDDWLKRPKEDGPSRAVPSDASSIYEFRSTARQQKPRVFHGIIASSSRPIEASIIEKVMYGRHYLCFETAASTMKSRPLCLLAGITKYCGQDGHLSTRERACKAVISYLTQLIQHIDRHELALEPAIAEYFVYGALDMEKPACRLLKLEGGTGELRCHIFQAYLSSHNNTSDDKIHDETMLIPYEALSYCWGSNDLTKAIRVNGKILLITSNLFHALGYLRFADRDRLLWIDAICIDQRNVLERGHQVDLMGRLYSQADEVLIWLGNIGDRTGALLSMLKAFEANVPLEAKRQWKTEDIRYRDLWNVLQHSSLENEDSLQSKLQGLMRNPWFSRVWIIQEVANAKKASLGCTDGWIDARTFAVVPNLLQIKPSTQCQSIIDIMPGASRISSWFNKRPNLSTLLWKFRDSQANDPRDRLYALLGISSDKPIAADYSKTEKNVVEEMIEYLFNDESISLDLHGSNVSAIQSLSSRGLEKLILRGADLDDLHRFTTRYTAPLLLETETVNYLRYVRSPFLKQLVHQDSLVLPEKGADVTLATFLTTSRIQVTLNIFKTSRQNGMGFVPMVLDLERDDIEITRELIIEAIRNGPSVLERFLDRYYNKATRAEIFGEQKILGDLEMLKDSFKDAGGFPKHSDTSTLRRLLYDYVDDFCDDYKTWSTRPRDNNAAEIFAELRYVYATLPTFLQQRCHQTKVTNEAIFKTLRGGQDGIKTFLESNDYYKVDDAMRELSSNYSVEVFVSSDVNGLVVIPINMWPGIRHPDPRQISTYRRGQLSWKLLIPYRVLGRDQGS
ncbi:hypothetical protein E8E14_006221 [Neopestalotiopsis sp. 37M]|nr:hypothetical protein E8E14_006221 [Neopestalotiopsis sp. 37M]